MGVGTLRELECLAMNEACISAQVRTEDGKPPTLTATTHEQIVELGTAADFGYCQSNRKARNQPCPRLATYLPAVRLSFACVHSCRSISDAAGAVKHAMVLLQQMLRRFGVSSLACALRGIEMPTYASRLLPHCLITLHRTARSAATR